MIGDAPKSIHTGVPGWESPNEENKLIELARLIPDGGLIVEIGGEYGRSASQFLYATQGKDIKVVTVDLFPTDHHVAGDLFAAMHLNIIEAKLDTHRHVQIKGSSWEVGQGWKGHGIDLLFIDGDHTYEGVRKDIEAWVKFVKPGGIVAFHDYAIDENSHYLHHEVKKAVDEWVSNSFSPIGQTDSLVLFARRLDEPEIVAEKQFGSRPVDNPTIPAIQEKKKTGRKPKAK